MRPAPARTRKAKPTLWYPGRDPQNLYQKNMLLALAFNETGSWIKDHSGNGRHMRVTQAVAAKGSFKGETGTEYSRGPGYSDAVSQGTMNTLTEASGLCYSRKHDGIVYTMEDSGGDASFYAYNSTGGAILKEYTITGGSNSDYEDIFCGTGPTPGESYVYVADTGDNNAVRASVTIYRMVEPAVLPAGGGTSAIAQDLTLTVTYPVDSGEASYNVETFFVDPLTGDGYLITKEDVAAGLAHHVDFTAKVFKIPAATLNLSGAQSILVTLVTTITPSSPGGTWINDNGVAAGDISSDGLRIVLRDSTDGAVNVADPDYAHKAKIWHRDPADSVEDTFDNVAPDTLELAAEADENKGEGICFKSQDNTYTVFTNGEGAAQDIFRFRQSRPWNANTQGPYLTFNGNPDGVAELHPSENSPTVEGDRGYTADASKFDVSGDFTLLALVRPHSIGKEPILASDDNLNYIRINNSATQTRIKIQNSSRTITHGDFSWAANTWQMMMFRRVSDVISVGKDGFWSATTNTYAPDIQNLSEICMKASSVELGVEDNYFDGDVSCMLLYDYWVGDEMLEQLLFDPFLPFRRSEEYEDVNQLLLHMDEGGGGGAAVGSRSGCSVHTGIMI